MIESLYLHNYSDRFNGKLLKFFLYLLFNLILAVKIEESKLVNLHFAAKSDTRQKERNIRVTHREKINELHIKS